MYLFDMANFSQISWQVLGLLLSLILLFIYIRQSIVDHKLYKTRIVMAFIITGVMVFDIALFDVLGKRKPTMYARDFTAIISCVIVGLCYFKNITTSSIKANLEQEFLRALENDKIFVLLDKKDRIKQISMSFLDLAESENKKEAVGRKFFDFFQDSFHLIAMNDQDIKISKLREFFRIYAEEVKEGDRSHREFVITKKSGGGRTYVLNLLDTPIFVAGKYAGHLMIGDLHDESSKLDAERQLDNKIDELNNIKDRFGALMNVSEESIFFYNIDDSTIWCNESLKKNLDLSKNNMDREEFEALIDPEDLRSYKSIVYNLTVSNSSYEAKYRFKTAGGYTFIKERGKRIFGKNGCDEVVGTIEIVRDKHFEKTNMTALDMVNDETKLIIDLEKLIRSNVSFEVVMFKMTNLPEINEKYGRSIGNMVLAEYVKAVKKNFINDDMIYRVTGLEFVIILTDSRKMQVLKRGFESGNLVSLVMPYGSLEIGVECNYGCAYNDEVANAKDALNAVKNALRVSQLPSVSSRVIYYRDIK